MRRGVLQTAAKPLIFGQAVLLPFGAKCLFVREIAWFARPRAGTALAPHLDRIRNAPFGARFEVRCVTEIGTTVKQHVIASATVIRAPVFVVPIIAGEQSPTCVCLKNRKAPGLGVVQLRVQAQNSLSYL
jgi:hypothetical protein